MKEFWKWLISVLIVLGIIVLLLLIGPGNASAYENKARTIAGCTFYEGHGKKLIFGDKEYMIWAKSQIESTSPFNEFNFSYYYGKNCRARGIKFYVKNIDPYLGWGEPGKEVIFDDSIGWAKDRFLLLHELGHVYGLMHTNNSTIMCNCRNNPMTFTGQQKEIMRRYYGKTK